jgi:hypothetical protein
MCLSNFSIVLTYWCHGTLWDNWKTQLGAIGKKVEDSDLYLRFENFLHRYVEDQSFRLSAKVHEKIIRCKTDSRVSQSTHIQVQHTFISKKTTSTSNNMALSLHTLPVELIYRILDKLDDLTLFVACRNVCTRLNTIIDTYHRYQVIFGFIMNQFLIIFQVPRSLQKNISLWLILL